MTTIKKILNLIVCALFIAISHLGYTQPQSNNPEDPCEIHEKREDPVFTLLHKCDILNELWGIRIFYMKAEFTGYPCDADSNLYYLTSKLAEKANSLLGTEKDLAKRYEEEVSLEHMTETLDLKGSADGFSLLLGYYPAHLEHGRRCHAKSYVIGEVYKELFGSEINFYYDYDRLGHLMEMAKARDGFNDEEIIEFLREPLQMIYDQEVESYNRFIEENKDILDEITLLARNEFKIKSNGANKCKTIRDKEFCAPASGDREIIQSLNDIVPYIKTLKQSSAK